MLQIIALYGLHEGRDKSAVDKFEIEENHALGRLQKLASEIQIK